VPAGSGPGLGVSPAAVRVSDLVVDCNDLVGQPRFWTGLLGLAEVSRSRDWVELGPLGEGGPALCFQLVGESKTAKNRLHLDVVVPDAVAAGRRAAELGASAAGALHQGRAGPWQVWRDPEGNEFCLISGAVPAP
jgi:Glyoxalase-like domain